MANIGTLTAHIGLDSTPLRAGAASAKRELAGVGSGMTAARGAVGLLTKAIGALGITLGATQAFRAAIAVSTEYRRNMQLSAAQMRATKDEVDALNAAAMGFERGPMAASRAMAALTADAKDAAEMIAVLPDLLIASKIAQMDMTSAAEQSHRILEQYGQDMSEIGKLNDYVTSTGFKTRTSVKEMYEALAAAAPMAAGLGYSLERTVAMIGAMALAGRKGGEAGSQLAISLMRANDVAVDLKMNTADLVAVLIALKAKGATAQEILARFSMRGGRAAVALLEVAGSVDVLQAALDESSGSAKRFADRLTTDIDRAKTHVTASAGRMAVAFGGAFTPSLARLHEGLARLLEGLVPAAEAVGEALALIVDPIADIAKWVGQALVDIKAIAAQRDALLGGVKGVPEPSPSRSAAGAYIRGNVTSASILAKSLRSTWSGLTSGDPLGYLSGKKPDWARITEPIYADFSDAVKAKDWQGIWASVLIPNFQPAALKVPGAPDQLIPAFDEQKEQRLAGFKQAYISMLESMLRAEGTSLETKRAIWNDYSTMVKDAIRKTMEDYKDVPGASAAAIRAALDEQLAAVDRMGKEIFKVSTGLTDDMIQNMESLVDSEEITGQQRLAMWEVIEGAKRKAILETAETMKKAAGDNIEQQRAVDAFVSAMFAELARQEKELFASMSVDVSDAVNAMRQKMQELDAARASTLNKVRNDLETTKGSLDEIMIGMGDRLGDAFAGLIDGTMKWKDAFHQMSMSIIADAIRMAVRLAWLKALEAALQFNAGGGGAATPSTSGFPIFPTGIPIATSHHGGRVGAGPLRIVPPEFFIGAARAHSGGWIGSREVPILAERGEQVLSRQQIAALGGPINILPPGVRRQVREGGGTNVYMTIQTPNVESFRASQPQTVGRLAAAIETARARKGS